MAATYLSRSLMVLSHYYCLCVTERDFQAELKRLNVPKREALDWVSPGCNATVHFLDNKGKRLAIVCVQVKPESTLCEVHGILVHEATHIWQDYIIGIGENRPSDEFMAYSMQIISQELMLSYATQVVNGEVKRIEKLDKVAGKKKKKHKKSLKKLTK